MIEIEVLEFRISLLPAPVPTHVLVFKEIDGERQLMVWMDSCEAAPIRTMLDNKSIDSLELTFNFLSALLRLGDLQLSHVLFSEVKDDLINCQLVMLTERENKSTLANIDCRIFDATALALAERVPIFVTEEVLEELSNDQNRIISG